MIRPIPTQRHCVLVCQYRSCSRNGSAAVLAAFQAAVPRGIVAIGSDCMGQCSAGVTVRVMPENFWYCHVKPEHASMIVEQHLLGNCPVTALLHPRFHPASQGQSPDHSSS